MSAFPMLCIYYYFKILFPFVLIPSLSGLALLTRAVLSQGQESRAVAGNPRDAAVIFDP